MGSFKCFYAAILDWIGYEDGRKQAIEDVKNCHEQNNAKPPAHHMALYKRGWLDGYGDVTGMASNDNGTYGLNNCKKYY
jgi:hypothetical protein